MCYKCKLIIKGSKNDERWEKLEIDGKIHLWFCRALKNQNSFVSHLKCAIKWSQNVIFNSKLSIQFSCKSMTQFYCRCIIKMHSCSFACQPDVYLKFLWRFSFRLLNWFQYIIVERHNCFCNHMLSDSDEHSKHKMNSSNRCR